MINNFEIHFEQDYCKHFDITVIRKVVIKNGDIVYEEISGFYYGEPSYKGLNTFKEKNKVGEINE